MSFPLRAYLIATVSRGANNEEHSKNKLKNTANLEAYGDYTSFVKIGLPLYLVNPFLYYYAHLCQNVLTADFSSITMTYWQ